MNNLTETLKKRKKRENALNQLQIYEKYCSDKERRKKHIDATNELYQVVLDISKRIKKEKK